MSDFVTGTHGTQTERLRADENHRSSVVERPSLREKLEAPAVIRSIIATSARVVDLLDERVLLQDEEMVAAGTELRRQLEALDAIRTGA